MENNTPTIFVDNTFYINSFFRETKEGNKLGLMFKGTTFDKDDTTTKFVMYHIDSARSGKNPFVILDIVSLTSLCEKIRTFIKQENDGTELNIEEGNLLIDFSTLRVDGNILFVINYGGRKYSFLITRGEFEVFSNSVSYIKSYNIKVDSILSEIKDEIVNSTDSLLKRLIIDKSITPDQVYKNKWIQSQGETKKYDIPAIQFSVHGAKSTPGGLQKVHYYFKFFPTYLSHSFRKKSIEENEKLSKISGGNFPIHIISQETGKSSSMITMSEVEFSIFLKYMRDPKFFLTHSKHPLVKFANDSDIVMGVSDKYILTMNNNYNGKIYTNEDTISKEQFDKIKEFQEDGVMMPLVAYIKSLGLEKNKFVNDNTVETMEIKKSEFVNFKVSRTDDGKIDERSAFLQISFNANTNEFIMTTAKGDTRNGGIRYVSAPFKSNEAKGLLYKLTLIQKYLTDYSMTTLEEIDRNLKTLDFLPLNLKDKNEVKEIINLIFTKSRSNLFFTEGDNKFMKNFEIMLSNGNKGIFSLFAPDAMHIFNVEAFSEWDEIKELKEHKYPLRFKIENDKGEKSFANFMLDLSDLGGINEIGQSVLNEFSLIGKSGITYRQLSFRKVDDEIVLGYGESSSVKGPFNIKEQGRVKFSDFTSSYQAFMFDVIMNSQSNIKKSIQYHRFNIQDLDSKTTPEK